MLSFWLLHSPISSMLPEMPFLLIWPFVPLPIIILLIQLTFEYTLYMCVYVFLSQEQVSTQHQQPAPPTQYTNQVNTRKPPPQQVFLKAKTILFNFISQKMLDKMRSKIIMYLSILVLSSLLC